MSVVVVSGLILLVIAKHLGLVATLLGSLYTRFRSRRDHTFAEKTLSAMRKKFGGHVERASGG